MGRDCQNLFEKRLFGEKAPTTSKNFYEKGIGCVLPGSFEGDVRIVWVSRLVVAGYRYRRRLLGFGDCGFSDWLGLWILRLAMFIVSLYGGLFFCDCFADVVHVRVGLPDGDALVLRGFSHLVGEGDALG